MLRAVVLGLAFWGGEQREGSVRSVFLLSSHVKKVGCKFFLYYCCWRHNCYIILEPFEKPVPSSVAWFPLCSGGMPRSLGEHGILSVPWVGERQLSSKFSEKMQKSAQTTQTSQEPYCTVFMQRINLSSWKLGFWNHKMIKIWATVTWEVCLPVGSDPAERKVMMLGPQRSSV